MNPIANKTVTKTIATDLEQGKGQTDVQKTGPSKFDQVRAEKMDNASPAVDLPPAVTEVSAAQKQVLETQMRQKLQGTSGNPTDVLKVDLGNTRVNLNQLSKRVSALPNTPEYGAIRNRFTSVEQQFNNANQLINNAGHLSQPDLLKAQTQIYLMTENVQLLSKVVDQVTSGVKTLLQTQI